MIVSHKHKFIFVKTHKTSTQTFMKFIKPHLGADDVMAGDPSNSINENTKVNVDKVFESTGKSALEYQEKYGNHLPWFIIKEIVGDDIWDEYTTFTIEREAKDRLVSLFCFLNPILIKEAHFMPSDNLRNSMKVPEIRDMLQNSLLDLYPEQTREYFQDLTILQLTADTLPLTDHITYSAQGVELERKALRDASRKLNLNKIYKVDNDPVMHTTKGGVDQAPHPYYPEDIWIRIEPYKRHHNTEGQCRLLNYGYYHDGKDVQVDKVINFNNVGNNIGNFFKNRKININCNKEIYNKSSQNIHYRQNKTMPAVNWWYGGNKGDQLLALIRKKFPG